MGAGVAATSLSGCIFGGGGSKFRCRIRPNIQWTTNDSYSLPDVNGSLNYKTGASWGCNDENKPKSWKFEQDYHTGIKIGKEKTLTDPNTSSKYPKKVDPNKYEFKYEKKWQYVGYMEGEGKRGIKVEAVTVADVRRKTVRWKDGYPKWEAVSWPMDNPPEEPIDNTSGTDTVPSDNITGNTTDGAADEGETGNISEEESGSDNASQK